ncbi:4Fe-4S binding protein [Telmatospirillum siberiense]|uniref:Polyferredoxin n=1 Tax=Telmatospirillum siberiense TaxID=382514 RepID=A0A2N3PP44_9PROT|nr:4Fe-4S binding protein [Telmatospirillum siberiense]PKU22134.1 polyferredoxin [Telmatospirillum siberiense]
MITAKDFGDGLYRRQDLVRLVQWLVVGLYVLLLAGPVIWPEGRIGRVAEILFWGVWWPLVIGSMMLIGQFWCGVLCPDGTVTEFASRRGRGRKPTEWLRWAWWPLALYSVLTFFSDAFQAHRSAWGTLLAVGGMSGLALGTGLVYGRGKRVWCRYLCPVTSIFSLLSRCSVLHFRVDRGAWEAAPRPVPKPVDCPLLLDVRRLTSNEKCNMCGRCSGHRGAVELAWRPLGSEIESLRDDEVRPWDAFGICYVLIGLSQAGLHWHHSASAMLAISLGLGSAAAFLLFAATGGRFISAMRLSYGLIPLAGFGLMAGAGEHSLALLAGEGVEVGDLLTWSRDLAVLLGCLWSGRLGWRLIRGLPVSGRPAGAAGYGACLLLLAASIRLSPLPF